tara:strand:- start:218 stop:1204 length:987 start_codon:yes stop_codon:yes gene_type:complete
MEKKIFITGTGRCGTTFLIKLFTALGYNTGYDMRELEAQIEKGEISDGMERLPRADLVNNFVVFKELTVFKAPHYVYQIDLIIKVLGNVMTSDSFLPSNTILSWTSASGRLIPNKGRPWVRKPWPHEDEVPGPILDPFIRIAEPVIRAPNYVEQLAAKGITINPMRDIGASAILQAPPGMVAGERLLDARIMIPDPVVEGLETCDEWPDPCSWIESFIVPIRNLKETAESAFARGGAATWGGLVKPPIPVPTTIEEQVEIYIAALDELKAKLEFYKVPVIYLDFKSMVNDKLYLYKEFSQMLKARDISQETFCEAYQRATGTWRKGEF